MDKTMLEVGYKQAKYLYKIGVINKEEFAELQSMCKPEPKKLAPKEIKKIRLQAKAKPEEFANCLNVTVEKVIRWEKGESEPNNTERKLLAIAAKGGLEALDC